MGLEQYEVGKSWEDEVMEYYMKKGFSTFKFPTEISGTVFDVFAVKNNKVTSIECKHTKTDKLYYKSSGLEHKRDDLDKYISNGNDVLIYIKSDKTGTFVTDWRSIKETLKSRGYITKEDCVVIKL